VTEESLARRLQQHGQLMKTTIIQKTDMSPILESIKREL